MRRGQGRLQRKGITSLSIITTPVIIIAATLCVLVLQLELPSLFGYVASGSSIFFPSIPAINLLGFLPDCIPAIPFTIGNLVDVIIDVYIILTIGIIPYRWHKSAREPGIAFNDLQLAVLIDPADILAKPCITKQGLVHGNTRKQEGGALYSGLDRMVEPSDPSFPAGRRAEAVYLRNAQANVYHFPVHPVVQRARKIPLNVITEPMIGSLPVSALYPRSRARLHRARDGYPSFSGKTRAMVIQFPIGIKKWMET